MKRSSQVPVLGVNSYCFSVDIDLNRLLITITKNKKSKTSVGNKDVLFLSNNKYKLNSKKTAFLSVHRA